MRGVRVVGLVGLALAALTASSWLAPAAASASVGSGLPLVPVRSATAMPPGFSSTAAQAEQAAEAAGAMQRLHRRLHPLDVQVFIWNARRWYVDFGHRGQLVAEVDVGPGGRVAAVWTGPLARAIYARGHYAPLFSSAWVLVPFSLAFLVPFLDPRRLRRAAHLDALAVLSLLVSFLLFEHARLEPAVWLVYPPLIYLLVRMLMVARAPARPEDGRPRGSERTRGNVERVLWAGLLALVAARIGLSLASARVIDVGYASVIGADRIAHGHSLYYLTAAHGDTYGPIMYLAYVPFELLFPWRGAWDYLPAAHVAALTFDLVTVGGLLALGRRLRPGVEGRRLGLRLAWAWAACPFTLLGLIMHTNDGAIAMLAVLGLLAFSSPAARGTLLGLAAAAKFFPALLLGLYAAGRERGRRPAMLCLAAFALTAGLSVTVFLPAGGLHEFYSHTIGYQLSRSDVFSAWSLHPGLKPVQAVLEAGAILLALAAALGPGRRTLIQVCAWGGAVTIAIQLPSTHWFYYYVVWFLPYVFVAMLGPDVAAGVDAGAASGPRRPAEPRPRARARARARVRLRRSRDLTTA